MSLEIDKYIQTMNHRSMCVSFAAEINIDPLLGRQAPFTEVSNPTQLTAPQISTVQLIAQDKNRCTFEIRTDAHLERIRQMRRRVNDRENGPRSGKMGSGNGHRDLVWLNESK